MSAAAMDLELVWTRPLAALALVLPVLLLVLARRPRRPPLQATGTLALWRRAALQVPAAARRSRPRVPPAVWVAAGALASGALALAGPRLERRGAASIWTVVVDDSPSTGLPAPGLARPRRELALERALAWLREHAPAEARVRWISTLHGERELALEEGHPAGLEAAPTAPCPAPRWAAFDLPGTLWVTDVAPSTPPSAAGLVASGADPVPGLVALRGRERLVWDGRELVTAADEAAPRDVVLAVGSRAVPAPLRRFAEVWCAARGFRLVEADAAGPAAAAAALLLEREEGELESEPRLVGRDGWRAIGRLVAAGAEADAPGWTTWLACELPGGARPVVRWRSGRVRVAWGELEEPRGDPAAFAVSWSALLDASTLPAPGVVPLDERLVAGPAVLRQGRAPAALPEPGARHALARVPLEAWLSFAALLLALLAAALGLVPRRRPSGSELRAPLPLPRPQSASPTSTRP